MFGSVNGRQHYDVVQQTFQLHLYSASWKQERGRKEIPFCIRRLLLSLAKENGQNADLPEMFALILLRGSKGSSIGPTFPLTCLLVHVIQLARYAYR